MCELYGWQQFHDAYNKYSTAHGTNTAGVPVSRVYAASRSYLACVRLSTAGAPQRACCTALRRLRAVGSKRDVRGEGRDGIRAQCGYAH